MARPVPCDWCGATTTEYKVFPRTRDERETYECKDTDACDERKRLRRIKPTK